VIKGQRSTKWVYLDYPFDHGDAQETVIEDQGSTSAIQTHNHVWIVNDKFIYFILIEL
jgi:hypothetical protein